MKQGIIRVRMLSEWLVSGEMNRTSGADQAQIRDVDGLPYIPGRSLKGLLREGAELLAASSNGQTQERIDTLFGGPGIPGMLRVADALLPAEVVPPKDTADGMDMVQDYVALIARTSVDDKTGSARPHSLRTIEVAIPGLELFAPIEVPDEDALRFIASAAALVRSLGAHRYRGLGRCQLTVLDGDEEVTPDAFGNNMRGGSQ